MAPPRRIRDRQQLAQLIQQRMVESYASLSEDQKLEAESSLVKTYLIEAHLPTAAGQTDVAELLKRAVQQAQLPEKATVRPTDEALFFELRCQSRQQPVTIFVDATNPRFPIAHSLNASTEVDWVLNRLTTSVLLDRVWLFAEMLERISGFGAFRGMSLDYDRRAVPDVDFEDPAAPVEFLKMQLWGSRSRRVLDLLRSEQGFPEATTLSKVKVKYRTGRDEDNTFSLDDVKFNGKITARGTSFHSHTELVSTISRKYAGLIEAIEARHRVSPEWARDRLGIGGEPVSFVFSRSLADMDAFCEHVFSGGGAFKLWGVPVRLSEQMIRVAAVDMHVGGRIDFELTSDFIRAYLHRDTCGNTLVRFYTNLQHHYDALVRGVDGDDNSAFLEPPPPEHVDRPVPRG